jgi:branched-chain amino acid transport system substrate-binding protein
MVVSFGSGASATPSKTPKSPILIGNISNGPLATPPILSLAEASGGINAAIKSINALGGIHGHPLKLVACDDAGNPNTAAACGRLMVKDKVAAVVGGATGEGANFLPILAAANIPSLGDFAISTADLTCATCFAMISSLSLIAGEGNVAAWAGNTNISMPYLDSTTGAQLPVLAGFGLGPYGLKLLNKVPVPGNAPDMSSYVAATMAGGTTGVLLGLVASDGARFVATAEQLGHTSGITWVGDCTNMSGAIGEGFASSLEGVYGVCLFLPPTYTSNPAVKAFNKSMKAYSSKAVMDDISENAWAATYLFKQVAMTLKNVTAKNVLKAMPGVTFHDGLLPSISFAKSVSPIPGFQIYNNDVLLTRVHNGKFVPLDGKFMDPFVKNTLP